MSPYPTSWIPILIVTHPSKSESSTGLSPWGKETTWKSLWIKPTNALNSSFIGVTTLYVSGSLSAHHQEFLAVHQLWYILCSCDDRMELQFHPAPGNKRSSQLHNMYPSRYTAKNSWWWAERLPETCRVVIPIKLEFIASVVLFTRNHLHC